jgi:hypothetical protein
VWRTGRAIAQPVFFFETARQPPPIRGRPAVRKSAAEFERVWRRERARLLAGTHPLGSLPLLGSASVETSVPARAVSAASPDVPGRVRLRPSAGRPPHLAFSVPEKEPRSRRSDAPSCQKRTAVKPAVSAGAALRTAVRHRRRGLSHRVSRSRPSHADISIVPGGLRRTGSWQLQKINSSPLQHATQKRRPSGPRHASSVFIFVAIAS